MNDTATPTEPGAEPGADKALRAKRVRAFEALGLGPSLRSRMDASSVEEMALADVDKSLIAEEAAPDIRFLRPDAVDQVATPAREALRSVMRLPSSAAPAAPVNRAVAPVVSDLPPAGSLEALRERVAQCKACNLCESRIQTVFSAGNPLAGLAIVGEAPGAEEDKTGLAFVGQSGKLLDNMLGSLGLNRQEHAYICNVVKCRPPNNRDPLPEEVARCEVHLQEQLDLVRPGIILVMGRFAAQSLLRTDSSVASLRGRVHSYVVAGRTVPVVVTYHPAYLLRTLADKAKAWSDLCLLKAEMERPKD